MKKGITLLMFSIVSFFILGQDEKNMNSGIIYGKNFAYSLTAPDGWVLDNTSGVRDGFDAVFYKKGGSWSKSLAVMYTNTASLEVKAHQSLDLLIKYDNDDFIKNYPDILITNGEDIVLRDGNLAKVKYLYGKSYKNYEAVAYIDAGKTCILIVLSSRSKDEYESSLTAFVNLVKSYWFMTDKVQNKKI